MTGVRTRGATPDTPDRFPEAIREECPTAPGSIYLHFPFCAHRCHYCDFSVTRSANPPIDAWLARIETECAWWFERTGWTPGGAAETVYLGGGTPSLLGGPGVERLAGILGRWFAIDAGTEWTAEANPASFTAELARAWRRAGVTRISLGTQSLDDRVLQWLGRLHDRLGAERAIRTAREEGFGRINVDLIFALPEEVERDLDREIEELRALDVPHLSLYGLTVETGTPLSRRVDLGRVTPAGEDRYADEYRRIAAAMRAAGYDHYEVSNFARDGFACRHNWSYWNRAPYLGLGPSAHGFLPRTRIWNAFRWDRYDAEIRAGSGPIEGWEHLSTEDEALERIWLALRTERGLPVPGTPPAAPGAEEPERMSPALTDRWVRAGWLEERKGRLVATTEGWLRMDTMAAEIAAER